MSLPPARYVDVGGVRTRYFDSVTGSEPTIVLVHGGGYDYRLGIVADDWDSMFDFVAQGYRVLAIDRLGAGGTDGPASESQYTMEASVAHLKDFLIALSLRNVFIVGHSRGALPAACLALELRDVIRGLVILNSNTLPELDPELAGDSYFPPGTVIPTEAMVRDRLGQAFENPDSEYAAEYIQRKLRNYQPGQNPHPEREYSQEALSRVARLEHDMFRPSIDVVRRRTLDRIRLEGIDQPTMIIWGANDLSAPIRLGYGLFDLIRARSPRAEMHCLGTGRHLVHVEYPTLVAHLILDFVERQSNGA